MHFFSAFLLTSLICSAQEAIPGKGLRFLPFDMPEGFVPASINDKGEIAGNHPSGAMLILPDGTTTILDIPGTIAAMNNRGQLVINGVGTTFLRQPDGTLELRTVDNAERVIGRGLNNLGQMVGSADKTAVLWDADGTSRRLSVPLGYINYSDYTYINSPVAFGINDRGTIAGGFQLTPVQWGVFRIKDASFVTQVGVGKFGVTVGITDTEEIFYTFATLGSGNISALLDQSASQIYSTNKHPFRAMSPDGTKFVADGFMAESCPTRVIPDVTRVHLSGGTVTFQIESDSDCQWQSSGNLGNFLESTGNQIQTIQIPASDTSKVVRVTIAGASVAIVQGEETCKYAFPGKIINLAAEGGTYQVPIGTTPGCSWTVSNNSPLVQVDPASGMGPAAVTVVVSPNTSSRAQFLGFSVNEESLLLYQAPATLAQP